MNINELIKKAHENAVQKGFYDCHACVENPECPLCKGTGVNHNKNIDELLMLIVSELGEALEAHRKDRFSKFDLSVPFIGSVTVDKLLNGLNSNLSGANTYFEEHIKDTFEDELADVAIRLFDLCGYLNIEPVDFPHGVDCPENVGEGLLEITSLICEFKEDNNHSWRNEKMYEIIDYLKFFCETHNIDLEKYIELKMKYNETREYKHGKKY